MTILTIPMRTPRKLRASKARPDSAEGLIGLKSSDIGYVVDHLQKGLPFAAVSRFVRESGLTLEETGRCIGLNADALHRRKIRGTLTFSESERLHRLSRLFAKAKALFEGDGTAAQKWLTTPKFALGYAVPLEFAASELGSREVESLIGRLEYGIPS